jgi:hypothetical protein
MNTERPPLGIMPEFMWKEIRLKQIDNAVDRYAAAGKTIPPEWDKEHEKLSRWLTKRTFKKFDFDKLMAEVEKEPYPNYFETYSGKPSDGKPVKITLTEDMRYKATGPPSVARINIECDPKEFEEAGVKVFVGGVEYVKKEQPKEEQKPNRDWQVECFTNGERNWWLQKNGFYTNMPFDKGVTASQAIDGGMKIFAVKRISDGEVFNVGETPGITNSIFERKIISFDITNDNMMVNMQGLYLVPFEKLKKLSSSKAANEKPNRDWEIVKKCPIEGTIFSVKRLLDGEVFSVGEEVNSTWGKQIIERFFITPPNEMMIAEFSTCRNPLDRISKSTPLTHDYVTKERCNELRKAAFEAAKMFSGSGSCSPKYYSFEAYDKDCNIQ